MLLEIFEVSKNSQGTPISYSRELIRPLDGQGLFWHCATYTGEDSIEYSEWYVVEELLKAHGVTKFSYIDKREY